MLKAQNLHDLKFICVAHFTQGGSFTFALKPFKLAIYS